MFTPIIERDAGNLSVSKRLGVKRENEAAVRRPARTYRG
jgi:hypothetical protein